jgi:hydrogenase maturation protease
VKTLVIGIGNPILGDDGVGVRVAEELAKLVQDEEITIDEASTSGFSLLDYLLGYEKVIIIDAIMTEEGEPGEIYRLKPEAFTKSVHLGTSLHDANLPTALELGRRLAPEAMPREIVIFAIEVREVHTFTEQMTEQVREAVPQAVKLVLGELGKK